MGSEMCIRDSDFEGRAGSGAESFVFLRLPKRRRARLREWMRLRLSNLSKGATLHHLSYKVPLFTYAYRGEDEPDCESECNFASVNEGKERKRGSAAGGIPERNDRSRSHRKLATFGDFFRRRELPFRPHLPAHIPRMTFVSTGKLPQINY